MFPDLRPFQVEAHEALRQGARDGHRRQTLMAPTGAGKTVLAMNIIREALAKGNRAMFLCDRKTLINQTSAVADSLGLDHGIIQAQNPRWAPEKPFQIASCQTLMRRGWPDNMQVLVIDENHTLYRSWVDFIQSDECKAQVVGLSATPFAKGMGKIFSNLVNATTTAALVESGVLVPLRVFSCRRPDMAGAETKGGEWTDEAAAKVEMGLVGDLVSEWVKLAENRKTIIFGSTVAHCEEIQRQFLAVDVQTELFTCHTTDQERVGILERFTGPDCPTRILVSVEALAKGFDVRDVGCICDCRPLRKSLSAFIQMVGRGLRCSPETGKSDCFLLDFSGNILRFMHDFEDIYHNGLKELDAGEKLDKETREEPGEPKECPSCGFSPFGRKCLKCGYAPPPKLGPVVLPGTMKEIMIGKNVAAESPADLYAQLATYARLHSAPEKQNGRAAHLYKDITGAWPPRHFTVDSAPWVEPSRATQGKIRSLSIAWRHRRVS